MAEQTPTPTAHRTDPLGDPQLRIGSNQSYIGIAYDVGATDTEIAAILHTKRVAWDFGGVCVVPNHAAVPTLIDLIDRSLSWCASNAVRANRRQAWAAVAALKRAIRAARPRAIHFRDIRMANNAGMSFPLCAIEDGPLDLEASGWAMSGEYAHVTCPRCRARAPKRYPWAGFVRPPRGRS